MKKLMLLAGLYCLHLSLYASSTASPGVIKLAPINATDRAKAHFYANYSGAQDVTWINLPDRNIYCVFHQGKVVNRVFYDNHGYWQYTLRGYPPSVLAKDVKDLVTDYYDGYRITWINEIQSTQDEPVYVINIENEDHIKVIKVVGDEIQQQQALKKE
jgi:hypothetical protein